MEFAITTNWKGEGIDHSPVRLKFECLSDGLEVGIEAPFFNDPKNPGGAVGKPFDNLWDYEVVEAFFLNSTNEEYLEVEFCPHGQHQVLVLKGRRNAHKSSIDLEGYVAVIEGDTWKGRVKIPWGYFPKDVDRMNAYAIHGSDENRQYEALYHEEKSHEFPDFHRLEYFKPFSFLVEHSHQMRSATLWDD